MVKSSVAGYAVSPTDAGFPSTGPNVNDDEAARPHDPLLSSAISLAADEPVFPLLQRVRVEVAAVIDTPLSWDQLRSPTLNFSVVRPLLLKLTKGDRPAISLIYCLLVARAHFLERAEEDLAFAAVNTSRADLCELLAVKGLSAYGVAPHSYELLHVLTTTFNPFAGATVGMFEPDEDINEDALGELAEFGRHQSSNALELAVLSKAKRFVKNALVQQVISAIDSGAVIYTPESTHALIQDNYKSRPVVQVYDWRQRPFLDHHLLRVPRIRGRVELFTFTAMLVLFLGVETSYSLERVNVWEVLFIAWTVGFALDEWSSIQEHGLTTYFGGAFNVLDSIWCLVFFAYLVIRVVGLRAGGIYARDRRFLAALSEYGIESSLTDAAAAREDDESDDESDSEPEPDDEADLTYLTAEDQRDIIRQFRQLEAARRGQRALAHYTLRQSDTAVKTLVDAIQHKRKALRRARRRANRLEGYGANLNWLCTVFCETLFIGKLLYPESFPIDPSSSASLSARHDALVASSTGRALVGAIEKQIDSRGLDFALWLKTGHEIEMLALPNLARLDVDNSSPSDRRRRALSIFVLRGVLVGSTPAVWALLPADGWLNRAEFAEWLRRPEVAALRTRSSGPNRAWTNGAPYGSWMDLDVFHVWSYDEHVDTFLSYLHRLAEITEVDLPSYRAVVNLLRTWEVAKTDFAGRGETYDERRARVRREKARRQADRDAAAGDVEMEEAAENDEPASSSSVSEPALPILGGSLSSLHVASDLVRFGLVAPPTDEEMAALLDRMTLGASRGLAELGFIRTRAQEVNIVGEGGAATTVRLEKTSAGPAFGKFATVFRKSLQEDINKVFREAGITLSASLLENLLCKFSRGSWGRIRDDADFRKVIESLPCILDTADPLWRDRGSPVDVANLRDRLVALAEEEETLVDQLLQAEAAVDELENRPVR